MTTDEGFKDNAGEAPDIEWDVASIDTMLFKLFDRLQREKRTLTIRDRRRFGGNRVKQRATGPRLA